MTDDGRLLALGAVAAVAAAGVCRRVGRSMGSPAVFVRTEYQYPDGVPGDEDDRGFLFTRAVETARPSGHDYDPSWDYEPDSFVLPGDVGVDAVEGVLPEVQRVAGDLGLGAVRVYYAQVERGQAARYVDGTSAEPILLLFCEAYRNEWNPVREIRLSLLHELGHAYLDSNMARTYDDEEEEGVERFAQTLDRTVLDEFIDRMGEG